MQFKVGDKVEAVDTRGQSQLVQGRTYTVHRSRVSLAGNPVLQVVEHLLSHPDHDYFHTRFKLVESHQPMLLSTDPTERKSTPIATGVLDYFPLALAEVAKCSKAGNDQHNPGQPLHWAKEKSTDHADCIARHLIDRDSVDTDGIMHAAKLAWRALALLQIKLEAKQ